MDQISQQLNELYAGTGLTTLRTQPHRDCLTHQISGSQGLSLTLETRPQDTGQASGGPRLTGGPQLHYGRARPQQSLVTLGWVPSEGKKIMRCGADAWLCYLSSRLASHVPGRPSHPSAHLDDGGKRMSALASGSGDRVNSRCKDLG